MYTAAASAAIARTAAARLAIGTTVDRLARDGSLTTAATARQTPARA